MAVPRGDPWAAADGGRCTYGFLGGVLYSAIPTVGGAFHIFGSLGGFSVEGGSSVSGNQAAPANVGALYAELSVGSVSVTGGSSANGNLAVPTSFDVGGRLGFDGDGARTCGCQPLLTARGCTLRDNAVTEGDGGALFLAYGAAAELRGTAVVGNRAGRCGGGGAASGCESLAVVGAPAAAAILLEVSLSGNTAPDGEGYRRYESEPRLFAFGHLALLVADSDLAGDVGRCGASSQLCARPEASAGALRAWRSAALSVSTATAEREPPSDAERLCELEAALASCSVEDEAPGQGGGGGSLAASAGGKGEGGALLDISPTHIRLEAFSGKLRPGTPASLAVRLYNGIGLPIRTSTLGVLVTVLIEPADPMLSIAGSGGGPGNGSHLRPVPEHPWQDAGLAFLYPGSAAGGSLAMPFADGLASWPYLTVRYVLVLTAEPLQDPGLYTDWSRQASEDTATCQPCPADASCFGGGVLVPHAGYWHSAPDSAQFHLCPYELACGGEADDGDACVAIVHVQYYIIITRLPVPYPDSVTKLQAAASAVTGAKSTVAFSYPT
ncbi:hypothetical protein GPECTOR_183g265 [Gonium pectorale]|uniref:Uncharacterized protein n=1 Tax=Gonium pectorale TaxID=33097 RepID=A0A150FX53_GONPE|nr:hypothetical protein GPECTOR_183g265 [Gonium pectorale]|eukprot:KXZ42204.1 hypothetical protein GPECTOR_183g265 [Gonium pectorale]